MMLDELLTQHNGLEREIERRAVTEVRAWLLSHKVTEIRVDDENEHRSHAPSRSRSRASMTASTCWYPFLRRNPGWVP